MGGNRFGTYSASEAVKAGLDLEMPGPSRIRGEQLELAINSKKLATHDVDARVRNVLNLVNWAAGSGVPENAPEVTADTAETAALLREAVDSSVVLLKNEQGALPFKKDKKVRLWSHRVSMFVG